jgi:hypothetical protein
MLFQRFRKKRKMKENGKRQANNRKNDIHPKRREREKWIKMMVVITQGRGKQWKHPPLHVRITRKPSRRNRIPCHFPLIRSQSIKP